MSQSSVLISVWDFLAGWNPHAFNELLQEDCGVSQVLCLNFQTHTNVYTLWHVIVAAFTQIWTGSKRCSQKSQKCLIQHNFENVYVILALMISRVYMWLNLIWQVVGSNQVADFSFMLEKKPQRTIS